MVFLWFSHGYGFPMVFLWHHLAGTALEMIRELTAAITHQGARRTQAPGRAATESLRKPVMKNRDFFWALVGYIQCGAPPVM